MTDRERAVHGVLRRESPPRYTMQVRGDGERVRFVDPARSEPHPERIVVDDQHVFNAEDLR